MKSSIFCTTRAIASPWRFETASKPEIIAFAQERIRRGHVAARNHRAAPDGQKINDHQHHGKDREDEERNHDRPRGDHGLQDRLGVLRQIRSQGRGSLREKRRCAREQREEIFHSESAVTIGSERQQMQMSRRQTQPARASASKDRPERPAFKQTFPRPASGGRERCGPAAPPDSIRRNLRSPRQR